MSWDQIVENIKTFFSQPVPIICCSVGSLLIFVLTVFSKTSLGKKALNELKNLIAITTARIGELNNSITSHKEDTEKKIEELKQSYQDKLAMVEEEKTNLEELLYAIAENINNVKIKELVANYKEKADKRINDISDVVNEELLKYKDSLDKEYQRKYDLLEEKVVAIEKKVEEQVKVVEEETVGGEDE